MPIILRSLLIVAAPYRVVSDMDESCHTCMSPGTLQHTATHCNTLQHTLQHIGVVIVLGMCTALGNESLHIHMRHVTYGSLSMCTGKEMVFGMCKVLRGAA